MNGFTESFKLGLKQDVSRKEIERLVDRLIAHPKQEIKSREVMIEEWFSAAQEYAKKKDDLLKQETQRRISKERLLREEDVVAFIEGVRKATTTNSPLSRDGKRNAKRSSLKQPLKRKTKSRR